VSSIRFNPSSFKNSSGGKGFWNRPHGGWGTAWVCSARLRVRLSIAVLASAMGFALISSMSG
jgi:hypothetical protein